MIVLCPNLFLSFLKFFIFFSRFPEIYPLNLAESNDLCVLLAVGMGKIFASDFLVVAEVHRVADEVPSCCELASCEVNFGFYCLVMDIVLSPTLVPLFNFKGQD